MESIELVLDILRTGAVLTSTEVQKDIDLEKHTRHEDNEENGHLGSEHPEQMRVKATASRGKIEFLLDCTCSLRRINTMLMSPIGLHWKNL